jgi:hypothetical protein
VSDYNPQRDANGKFSKKAVTKASLRSKKDSPEHRKRLSSAWENNHDERSGVSHYRWKGGRPKCQDCGAQLARYGAKRCRKCFAVSFKGENGPNWRGGIASQNKLARVRFVKHYRELVLERDKYMCVECGSGEDLHVDHIKPWAEYPKLRFVLDNCRTLCIRCHYKVTYGRELIGDTKWCKPERVHA